MTTIDPTPDLSQIESVEAYLTRDVTGTRERLIQTAMRLFYRQGIHAVGLDLLVAEVGVTKTTFYNHFESKDALAVEVLDRRGEMELAELVRQIQARGGDCPKAQMLSMFDVLHDSFYSDVFYGCQYANAAAEFPSPHDPVHQAAARHRSRERELLVGLAQRAGADDPGAVADLLLMLAEGCIGVRALTGREDAARIARGFAQTLLEKQLPGV